MQTLSQNSDGYIVRCKQCGNYQIAFMTAVLTFSAEEFRVFGNQVKFRAAKRSCACAEHTKSVVLHTASPIVCLILTRMELNRLNEMMEECESEIRAQEIISLFNDLPGANLSFIE